MTINHTHSFVSTVPNDPNAIAQGEVVPSNWNAQHILTGTANTVLQFDGSGNALDASALPPVTSITLNFNGGASNSIDPVAVGGWESSGTQAFFHISFPRQLVNNVSSLTISNLTDFNIFDGHSASFQTVNSINLGHGGKNGCYLTAAITPTATAGDFAELGAVTTSASMTFS